MPHTLAFLNNVTNIDGLVVLVIGILIFGRRLPEVARNLKRSILEFERNFRQGMAFELLVILSVALLLSMFAWWLTKPS